MKYAAIALGAFALLSVLVLTVGRHSYEKKIVDLQNALAEKDKTVEVQKGLYEKLTIESKNLRSLLDKSDVQQKELIAELKKKDEQLLTTSSLVAKWKSAYEAHANAHQSNVQPAGPVLPDPPEAVGESCPLTRVRVDFDHDFGYIGVRGYTLTNPADAWVHVQQNHPLKITLAISRDSTGRWHTYSTSSEDNVAIDIGVTGVDDSLLRARWYEKIGVMYSMGVGSLGILANAGITYSFGKYELGPMVSSDMRGAYYGLSFLWHPFLKN
jgi:hypothetical protein